MKDNNDLWLYLNVKTFQTTYKGIFKYNEDEYSGKIKTFPLFIKNECYLFGTKNNDIITYTQQGL